ncbi:MAG TPA: hypothetical protein VFG10_15840 [Saprospiraceae bacterium]|nr:hypothetical protein [Saprospiraceae bacterium]
MDKFLRSFLLERRHFLMNRISSEIKLSTIGNIARNIFYENFIHGDRIPIGHNYYLKITKQKKLIKKSKNFMQTFKSKYGLSYIDRDCLKMLERNKNEIIDKIDNSPFVIYEKYFANAIVTFKGEKHHRSLNSFFTKLAHTVSPHKFSALDNPIRKYLKVNSESFFISYILINDAYLHWIKQNNSVLLALREKIRYHDKENILSIETLSDLKLLDMIFWFKANPKKLIHPS